MHSAGIFASLALAAATLAAQELPTFRSGVHLVKIDARVTAPDGRSIQGLQKQDFNILDDGQQQTVVACTIDENALDVVLLFDISRSMGPVMRRIAASATAALSQLRAGDRIAVMSFDTGAHLEAPLTSDLAFAAGAIAAGLPRTAFTRSTWLQESLDDAARYLLRQGVADPQRNRAVIIFTDNDGYGREFTKGVIRRFWEADAVLDTVLLGSAESFAMHARRLYTPDDVLPVVDNTGGRVIYGGDNPGSAFAESIAALRSRYTLFYAMPPGKPGRRRQVQVKLSAGASAQFPDSTVVARKGYVAPKEE